MHYVRKRENALCKFLQRCHSLGEDPSHRSRRCGQISGKIDRLVNLTTERCEGLQRSRRDPSPVSDARRCCQKKAISKRFLKSHRLEAALLAPPIEGVGKFCV